MSPQQALQTFDNVGAAYVGKREDHVQMQMAVSVLRELVTGLKLKAQRKTRSKHTRKPNVRKRRRKTS